MIIFVDTECTKMCNRSLGKIITFFSKNSDSEHCNDYTQTSSICSIIITNQLYSK